jgi:hypothetical protein
MGRGICRGVPGEPKSVMKINGVTIHDTAIQIRKRFILVDIGMEPHQGVREQAMVTVTISTENADDQEKAGFCYGLLMMSPVAYLC